MTNYYSHISRAIALLTSKGGEARRSVYQRARMELLSELRRREPPLTETEITRELVALEKAIRAAEGRFVASPPYSDISNDTEFPEKEPLSLKSTSQLGNYIEEHYLGRRLKSEQYNAEDQQTSQSDDKSQRELDAKRRKENQESKPRESEDHPHVLLNLLADIASPAPFLSTDGRLDAGPNAIYDVPEASDDLLTLPIRQRALIQILLSDLPRNAPAYLKAALQQYDLELSARGTKPILGVLKDVNAIIEAACSATNAAREWLDDGMQTALHRFVANHALFVKCFPLDRGREELYAHIAVDENSASGSELLKPFQNVASAASEANEVVTDGFVKIVEAMTEFAKVVSTLPPSQPAKLPREPTISDDLTRPSKNAKRRMLLGGFGFFERALHLLATLKSLSETPAGSMLLKALREATKQLSKFIGL